MAKAQSTDAPLGRWIRIAGWSFAAALMLTPVVGMQLSDEWNWDETDFIFAGIMIGGTGLLLELTARASRSWAYRGGVLVALLANFLIIWINAAVGIIGGEDSPRNLIYFGVIGIALVGAGAARFRAAGMALAMLAAGIATALVGIGAAVAGPGAAEPSGPFRILVLHAFFAGLWLLSACLFARAARQD